jgi:hypothetical protein
LSVVARREFTVDVLVERLAGLDVGKAVVVVCVRTPGRGGQRVSEVRTYRTMSRSLEAMADWLLEQGVTLAGMQSAIVRREAPPWATPLGPPPADPPSRRNWLRAIGIVARFPECRRTRRYPSLRCS